MVVVVVVVVRRRGRNDHAVQPREGVDRLQTVVQLCRGSDIRHNGRCAGHRSGAELPGPHLHVGDPIERPQCGVGAMVELLGPLVQQYHARLPHQLHPPPRNEQTADDAHDGVEGVPAQGLPAEQRGDGGDAGEGVGCDVEKGRPQVVVAVRRRVVAMAVSVGVVVPMVGGGLRVVFHQDGGADQVDDESHHRHGNGLFKGNLDRRDQASHALAHHLERHQRQRDGAAEADQAEDLAHPKRKAGIGLVPPGIGVAEERESQRARVARHVPAVGPQRHAAGEPSHHELHHHGDQREHHHDPGATLIASHGVDGWSGQATRHL